MTLHEQDRHAIVLPDFNGVDHLYVQKRHASGAPDFKGTNTSMVDECIKIGRCGACGLRIRGSWHFIIGASEMRGRTPPFVAYGDDVPHWIEMSEPPLHLWCARLAGRLCPILRKQEGGAAVIIGVPKGAIEDSWRGGYHPRIVSTVEAIPKRA